MCLFSLDPSVKTRHEIAHTQSNRIMQMPPWISSNLACGCRTRFSKQRSENLFNTGRYQLISRKLPPLLRPSDEMVESWPPPESRARRESSRHKKIHIHCHGVPSRILSEREQRRYFYCLLQSCWHTHNYCRGARPRMQRSHRTRKSHSAIIFHLPSNVRPAHPSKRIGTSGSIREKYQP